MATKKLNIRTVNNLIAARGIKATLFQGRGYLYFMGDDVAHSFISTSVYVCWLNHQTLDQWMADLDEMVASSKQFS